LFIEVKVHKAKAVAGTSVKLPCTTPHKTYDILTWYRNDSSTPVATAQGIYTHVSCF